MGKCPHYSIPALSVILQSVSQSDSLLLSAHLFDLKRNLGFLGVKVSRDDTPRLFTRCTSPRLFTHTHITDTMTYTDTLKWHVETKTVEMNLIFKPWHMLNHSHKKHVWQPCEICVCVFTCRGTQRHPHYWIKVLAVSGGAENLSSAILQTLLLTGRTHQKLCIHNYMHRGHMQSVGTAVYSI